MILSHPSTPSIDLSIREFIVASVKYRDFDDRKSKEQCLREENGALQSRNESLTAENERVKADRENLRSESTLAQNAVAEHERLLVAIKTLTTEKADLEAQLKASKEDETKQVSESSKKSTEITIPQVEYLRLRGEVSDAMAETARMQAETGELKSTHERLEHTFRRKRYQYVTDFVDSRDHFKQLYEMERRKSRAAQRSKQVVYTTPIDQYNAHKARVLKEKAEIKNQREELHKHREELVASEK
ncbi:hypothetical protein LTR66_015437, partial [Elasticomyces elasticus]